jgi:biogenesis of lysosome-related organelles complex 1 subunit KXD1
MASYSAQYYDYSSAVPIPSKHEQYSSYYTSGGSNYSASPDDGYNDGYNDAYNDASVTSGVPSYNTGDYSTNHSTYAESNSGDWDSSQSASGVDFNDYMHDRFHETFDPIPLDRSLAQQAQT